MNMRLSRLPAALLAAVLLAGVPAVAHHAISAKFDSTKPRALRGIVTNVDWKNPHVHVFVNVRQGNTTENWAVELESPLELARNGWTEETVHPGDEVTVDGILARNGSRQVWSNSMKLAKTNREVFKVTPAVPPTILAPRPTPRHTDGKVAIGSLPGGAHGYWAFPSKTVLVEDGVTVDMDKYGLLKNVADASKVAPLQPWALALYQERQRRFLQDDPTYINCKPPGGPRQFQLSEGVAFVEDKERQRIFVLVGGGNANFRIMYLDGRTHAGQVGGDDDNPLYYGRAVARWDGDTLVSDTRGFNEDFWFTNGGLPHSDQLTMTERFTRPNLDTLNYEVTIDDPGAYTRPWKASWTLRWVADQELPRHLCQDNRP